MKKTKHVIELKNTPSVIGHAAVVGKKEKEGPLGDEFDLVCDDTTFGEESWEKAESKMQKTAIDLALKSAGLKDTDADMIFAGDLLNQCTGSNFGIRDFDIPFLGMYGACSTMALSLMMSSIMVDSQNADIAVCATSSHFCSAEKQFRLPLEYGGQRPPTAQWTATAAGSLVIAKCKGGNYPQVKAVIPGRVRDLGITDANNMGAAMAPAACDTIGRFLTETGTKPEDYDLILTGDLGAVGSRLLYRLMDEQFGIDIKDVHSDCGLMIYYLDEQDVNSGGSGCGCSGSVLSSKIIKELTTGKLKKVLFVATGALMSSVSSLQGESIPGIAHGVLLTGNNIK